MSLRPRIIGRAFRFPDSSSGWRLAFALPQSAAGMIRPGGARAEIRMDLAAVTLTLVVLVTIGRVPHPRVAIGARACAAGPGGRRRGDDT